MYEYVCSCLCMFVALNRYVSPARREFYVISFAVYSVDPIARVATSNVVANNPIKFYAVPKTVR